jgi:hypothetical protein
VDPNFHVVELCLRQRSDSRLRQRSEWRQGVGEEDLADVDLVVLVAAAAAAAAAAPVDWVEESLPLWKFASWVTVARLVEVEPLDLEL